MFGESFGKTTHKSKIGDVHRGRDLPPQGRYQSLYMDCLKSPAEMIAPTVASTVGVNKPPEVFDAVILFISIAHQSNRDTKVLGNGS